MKRLREEQGDARAAQFRSEYDSRRIWGYVETAVAHLEGATAMKRFASFDGTRIAYSDEGDGPAVIRLHGFGMSGLDDFGSFDRLLPRMERRSELIRDLVGAVPPLPTPPPEGRPGPASSSRTCEASVPGTSLGRPWPTPSPRWPTT
jgi:hypothetical protein